MPLEQAASAHLSRPPSPWPHLGTQGSLQLQAQAGHSPLQHAARASVGVAGVPCLSSLPACLQREAPDRKKTDTPGTRARAQTQKLPAPCHALGSWRGLGGGGGGGGWPPTARHTGAQKQEFPVLALWGHSSHPQVRQASRTHLANCGPVVDGPSAAVSCYPLVVWALCCEQAGYSSVGRASDCRALQLSDGPWFDSGWPDFRG